MAVKCQTTAQPGAAPDRLPPGALLRSCLAARRLGVRRRLSLAFCRCAQLDSTAKNENNHLMKPIKERTNSNIIAACIVAAGLIVASVVIAKPKMPFQLASVFPPIPLESAKQQLLTQMQAKMVGAQSTEYSGEKVTFQSMEIESASYDAEARSYHIRYNLHWNNRSRSVTGTGCILDAQGNNNYFIGSCNSGMEKVGKSYRDKTVTVYLTSGR